ncbi:hypothetical protein ACVWYG_000061 [Pedobacter sp. UYEF25]
MKNLKSIFFCCILSSLIVFGLSSCKKEQENGAPTISRVRTVFQGSQNSQAIVAFDSTTTSGKIGNRYAIIGNNLNSVTAVLINGVSIYFNKALVSNTTLQFSVPVKFGFGGTVNTLTIISPQGQATTPFSILQPAASITSFSPVVTGTGGIVTITGTLFDNLIAVRFDDIPAEIIGTPTPTEIQVKVPAGVVQAFIYVQTAGGIAKSVSPFGFKALVYGDGYTTSWASTGYNSTTSEVGVNVKRGTLALKCDFLGGYGAYRAGYSGPDINVAAAGITAIKLSIFGGPGSDGKKVNISLNDTYTDGKRVTLILTEGKYTDYIVPLSSLGSPTTLTEIILQEFSGFAPSTIYIDDIGFI